MAMRGNAARSGACVECGKMGSKKRVYGAYVCDEDYTTDRYKLITKNKAMVDFGLSGEAIETAIKAEKVHVFKKPNPYGKKHPPMKLLRYYDLIVLFPNRK